MTQMLDALERANEIRGSRARLKRSIATGEVYAADILRNPPGFIETMPLAKLLGAQNRWGPGRTQRFLRHHRINGQRLVGEVTERQRLSLAAYLDSGKPVPFR